VRPLASIPLLSYKQHCRYRTCLIPAPSSTSHSSAYSYTTVSWLTCSQAAQSLSMRVKQQQQQRTSSYNQPPVFFCKSYAAAAIRAAADVSFASSVNVTRCVSGRPPKSQNCFCVLICLAAAGSGHQRGAAHSIRYEVPRSADVISVVRCAAWLVVLLCCRVALCYIMSCYVLRNTWSRHFPYNRFQFGLSLMQLLQVRAAA
jgi:hypothetical protein